MGKQAVTEKGVLTQVMSLLGITHAGFLSCKLSSQTPQKSTWSAANTGAIKAVCKQQNFGNVENTFEVKGGLSNAFLTRGGLVNFAADNNDDDYDDDDYEDNSFHDLLKFDQVQPLRRQSGGSWRGWGP